MKWKNFERFCERTRGITWFTSLGTLLIQPFIAGNPILYEFASLGFLGSFFMYGIGRHIPQNAIAWVKQRKERQKE